MKTTTRGLLCEWTLPGDRDETLSVVTHSVVSPVLLMRTLGKDVTFSTITEVICAYTDTWCVYKC